MLFYSIVLPCSLLELLLVPAGAGGARDEDRVVCSRPTTANKIAQFNYSVNNFFTPDVFLCVFSVKVEIGRSA